MRTRFFILLLLTLLVNPIMTQAQNVPTWSAWIYAQASGAVRLIDSRGALLDEFMLPTLGDSSVYPFSPAVSPDGRRFVYTLLNDTTAAPRIVAYNRDTEVLTNLTPTNLLSDSLTLSATRFIFNEAQNVAIGYSLAIGGWFIEGFDGAQPDYEAATWRLASDNPLVRTLGLPTQQGMTPVIHLYQGSEITFSLIPYGTEYSTPIASYTWDVISGSISADHAYPSLDTDTYVPTGEVISAVFESTQPHHTQDFMGGQQNTLQAFVPGPDVRVLFYLEPELTLYRPRFVEHGRRILFGAFDETTAFAKWQLLERDGTPVQPENVLTTPTDFVADAQGVADGFIYLTNVLSADSTYTLLHVDTSDGLDSGDIVWIGPAGEVQHILWVDDAQMDEPVTEPFIDWNLQLQIGAQAAGVSPLDVPTPGVSISSDVLTVGGTAIVQTTAGDQLNVRSGPGTEFEIVARLDNGTRVTLLEGPRFNGGFGWWNIDAGDVEGWVVESVEDNGVRLETLVPG